MKDFGRHVRRNLESEKERCWPGGRRDLLLDNGDDEMDIQRPDVQRCSGRGSEGYTEHGNLATLSGASHVIFLVPVHLSEDQQSSELLARLSLRDTLGNWVTPLRVCG